MKYPRYVKVQLSSSRWKREDPRPWVVYVTDDGPNAKSRIELIGHYGRSKFANIVAKQAARRLGIETRTYPKRNPDIGLRELERHWQQSGLPIDGMTLAKAFRRAGDEGSALAVEADVAGAVYRAEPTFANYLVWAAARSAAGFSYEGIGLDNFVWGWINSGFANDETGDSSYPGGVFAARIALGPDMIRPLIDEVGGVEGPGLPPLAARLPVDAYRFVLDHVGAIATVDHYGNRGVDYYKDNDEFDASWAEAENLYGEEAHEDWEPGMPNPPSKARLKKRLAASGWTVRKPQKWLTIYTAPSGLVEIWDRGQPHPERYSVLTVYQDRWVTSSGASTFDKAVRGAIKDLGLVDPLPNQPLQNRC